MNIVNNNQIVLQENRVNPFSSRPKYPDFRFYCPSCGSLDVFVTLKNDNALLKGQCLDCKKDWLSRFK